MKGAISFQTCFKTQPPIIQKEFVSRSAMAMLAMLLIISMFIIRVEFVFILPALSLLLFFVLRTVYLIYQVHEGKYIIVEGQCLQLEYTSLKRYVKSVLIQVGEKKVKVFLRGRAVSNLMEKDIIVLYLSEETPVYEEDGYRIINSYIAISRKET